MYDVMAVTSLANYLKHAKNVLNNSLLPYQTRYYTHMTFMKIV